MLLGSWQHCLESVFVSFAALFRLAESYNGHQESDRGSMSRSALKILLEDLSQVRKTIQ